MNSICCTERKITRLSRTAIPGVAPVLALLPKCPLCWPAYAALLAALGLSPTGAAHVIQGLLILAVSTTIVLWSFPTNGTNPRERRRPAMLAFGGGSLMLCAWLGPTDWPSLRWAGFALFFVAVAWSARTYHTAERRIQQAKDSGG
jgi:hypothetical protein